MAVVVNILRSAKDDFREIKAQVQQRYGKAVWATVNQQYKATLSEIAQYPMAGLVPDEALALGLEDIRQRLVGQTRVIYQFDGRQVYVHMFVATKCDFPAKLSRRFLA